MYCTVAALFIFFTCNSCAAIHSGGCLAGWPPGAGYKRHLSPGGPQGNSRFPPALSSDTAITERIVEELRPLEEEPVEDDRGGGSKYGAKRTKTDLNYFIFCFYNIVIFEF